MPLCKTLDAIGRIELRPFGAQRGNGIAFAADFAADLGKTLGLHGGLELDVIDVSRRHQRIATMTET